MAANGDSMVGNCNQYASRIPLEDFWNHGSDGYATVLVWMHFISIKRGLLKLMHHPGEALCCSLCLEQVQQRRGT